MGAAGGRAAPKAACSSEQALPEWQLRVALVTDAAIEPLFRSNQGDTSLHDTDDMFESTHNIKNGVFGVLYTVSKVCTSIPVCACSRIPTVAIGPYPIIPEPYITYLLSQEKQPSGPLTVLRPLLEFIQVFFLLVNPGCVKCMHACMPLSFRYQYICMANMAHDWQTSAHSDYR